MAYFNFIQIHTCFLYIYFEFEQQEYVHDVERNPIT